MAIVTSPREITSRLTTQIGNRDAALSMMRRDLGTLWSFLAPRQIVCRNNNLDYLAEARTPHISTFSVPTEEEITKCDVILALGSNDLTTPQQATALYELINETKTETEPLVKIVASGKGGHTTVPRPVFNMREALRYQKELCDFGVPKSSIIIDPKSENSGDNIKNSFSKFEAGDVPKRVAIVQTPAAQLRANLTFEKQWGDKDWDYYISCPPPLPEIGLLSGAKVDYYLAYALREAMTLFYNIHGPAPKGGRFVTTIDFPFYPILTTMRKYGDILFGENKSLDQLCWDPGFRGNFDAEESPYLRNWIDKIRYGMNELLFRVTDHTQTLIKSFSSSKSCH